MHVMLTYLHSIRLLQQEKQKGGRQRIRRKNHNKDCKGRKQKKVHSLLYWTNKSV